MHRSHIVLVLGGGRISRLRLPHWSHSTIAPLVKHSSCAQFLLPSHLQRIVPSHLRSGLKALKAYAAVRVARDRGVAGVRFGFLLGDGALPPKYARARPKCAPALFVYRLDQSKWAWRSLERAIPGNGHFLLKPWLIGPLWVPIKKRVSAPRGDRTRDLVVKSRHALPTELWVLSVI